MSGRAAGCAAVLLAGLMLGVAAGPARAAGYHLVRRIPMPQISGWDYLTLDGHARRLYLSNNSGVVVVNADTLREVGTVPSPADWPGVGLVHGIATSDRLGLGFITREIPSSIVTFRLANLRVLRSSPTDAGSDGIVYDPVTERVFAFNGKHPGIHDATAVDGRSGRVVGRIELPGIPEAAVADGHGSLYVNIASTSELARIDARALKVVRVTAMGACRHPSALGIDRARGRLFAACDNRILVMISARTGGVLASVPTGDGTDAVAFDPGTREVLASNGEGSLTVAREVGTDRLQVLQQVKTAPGARTMALDPRTHRVFLLTARFGSPPQHRSKFNPHGYPVAKPGSARLLVFAP